MKSQKFKHVILTRYNLGLYDTAEADEWMDHRYEYFKKTRASVLGQEGEFEWVIGFDDRTPKKWINKIISDKRMSAIMEHPNQYRNKGWTITTRLDNDDILLPGAVMAIQNNFTEKEIVIDLKYYQVFGNNLHTSGIKRDGWERPQPNGPFLSLIENDVKKTAYARPHSKMTEDYKCTFADRKSFALMVIHAINMANKIVGKPIQDEGVINYINSL